MNSRNMMITDRQYQALLSRSRGPSSAAAQLQATQGAQYGSRKLLTERVAAADQYQAAENRVASLAGSAVPYTPTTRADSYPDSQDIRAQLAVERRSALLPSPALVDYSPPRYVDHVGSRVLAGTPISPEVVGAYSGHYLSPTPQRSGQPLTNADLLAARARRSEIAASLPGAYGNEVRRIAPASSYDETGLYSGQAAGILGPGGARRGRELDQYLLSVQPEKLVRYADSVLAPDPVLRRSVYPMAVSNLNSEEDDPYSNYRRAKARRTESQEFGVSEPGGQRVRERSIYREREQYRDRRGGVGESGRERRRQSPERRQTNGSSGNGGEANRLDRLVNDTSQSFEGKHGQRNGGRDNRTRASEAAGKRDREAEPKEKVEDPDSDKDSELGSLCADLSDSDEDKVEKKSDDAATVIDGPLAGMIFGCSSATFHECMRLHLFGLPAKSKDDVMRVTPGTKVFLFNFDTKELSGIFEAVSQGGWQLQPDAFRDFGGFPAQVQVCCSEQCPNISQSVFKPAIKENYVSQTRFRFDLNVKQVKDLVRLFRQARRQLPEREDPLADRYLSARLQSEDYLARGGQQQRLYARHPQARFGKSRVPYTRVISMSPESSIRKSKRGSNRALRGRKKTKLSNKPESPMADNCSLYSLSGEMQEADVTINASGCDDASNTTNAVIVREAIETGNSRNVDQQTDIIETPAAKGIAPSGSDSDLTPRKPEETPCARVEVSVAAEVVGKEEESEVIAAEFAIDSEAPLIIEEVTTPSEVVRKDEGLEVISGEVLMGSESPSVREEVIIVDDDTKEKLEVIAAEVAIDSEVTSVREEVVTAVEAGDEDQNLEVIAAEVAADSETACVREEMMIASGSLGKDEELEVVAVEVALYSAAPCVREEGIPTPTVGAVSEELEMIAAEVAVDSEPCFDREEAMTPDGAFGKDGELEVTASELAVDSETLCVREDMMIAAQALSSQLLASADVEDKVTFDDGIDQGEEVILAVEAVDSEQPSPDLSVIHGDDEDEEEEVLLAGNAVHSEPDISADEDEDQVEKYQEDEYEKGEDEDNVDVVSVDGELSNVGEDGDEDEDNGEAVDDDASYDG